jgi:hypothetical protein
MHNPLTEHHFQPADLAKLWGLSPSKVRRLFENEPDVLRIGEPSRRVGRVLKRAYYTLRIPQSVAQRVHDRLTARSSLTARVGQDGSGQGYIG